MIEKRGRLETAPVKEGNTQRQCAHASSVTQSGSKT